ncbi:MAG: transglycosylase domain-containing protein [Actinomycetes bacterium]
MANKSRKPKRKLRRILPSIRQLLVVALVGFGLAVLALSFSVRVAAVPAPSEISVAQTSILYYDDGVTELGRLGEANRVSVNMEQIPLFTQQAILAAEDRDFYNHGGFSIRGISRAIFTNLIGASGAGGGSTITQQYAKNAYLTQERTLSRKYKELVLSIKLETIVAKDQILNDYLNTIYFGRGSYGIATAANQYFDKNVVELNLSESALLAAIIQAPNGLAPEENLERLTNRWNYVLDGMAVQGWITAEERSNVQFPMIVPNESFNTFGGPQGYLIEQVRQTMFENGITEDQINLSGLRVITTFNKVAQDALFKAVLEEGPTENIEGLRIGVASVRPETGEVVAIYGGADYLLNQFNNATQMIGQAGSTFKPFTLAAALENNVTLATTFSGLNKTMVDNYEVVNYGDKSYGDQITLLNATENSVNSAYVELANLVGREVVFEAAKRAGIPADTVGMEPNLAFTLGTTSPNVVDIAAAYATFASRGLQVSPSYIISVTASSGEVILQLAPKPVQAFSTDIADTVNYALQKVVTAGTGKAAKALGRPVAGKTGTTNENKSALFAGYTPELATAVMFVKDGPDGQPMSLAGTGGLTKVTGGSYPARIFTAYMKGALADKPVTKFAPLPTGAPDGANPTSSPVASPFPSGLPGVQAPVVTAVAVPDLLGKSISEALVLLSGANLMGNFVMSDGGALPANTAALIVVSQSLVANSAVPAGTTIIISVK